MLIFLSRRSTFWTLLILVVVCQVAIYFLLQPLVTLSEVLELQLAFSRGRFINILAYWEPEGVENFLRHYWVDFFYPVVYSSFLISTLLQFKMFIRETTAFKFLVAVPIAAAIFDEIENLCHLAMIKNWVPIESPIFEVGFLSSCTKWCLLFLCISTIFSATIRSQRR